MSDPVTVRGVVATRPRHVVPQPGRPITSFRLVAAGTSDWRGHGVRGPGDENWFTVIAFHELAVSTAACVARGDPLVVTGRLRVRDWEGEPPGVTVEIEAEAIGHDLAWGRSVFTRSIRESALAERRDDRGERVRNQVDRAARQGDPPGSGP